MFKPIQNGWHEGEEDAVPFIKHLPVRFFGIQRL